MRSPRSKLALASTPASARCQVGAGNWSSTSTSARARSATSPRGTPGARLFDRCAPKDGIVPFDELVDQFMSVEPYRSAPRVFVIADNGSAHRGQRSIDRLKGAWPNLTLVHTPVHASWLNQADIYFSIVQRKALQPNKFADLDTLERTLLAFGRRYEQIATPFEWKFTRDDLHRVLERLDQPTPRRTSARRMTELVNVLAKTTTEPPGHGGGGRPDVTTKPADLQLRSQKDNYRARSGRAVSSLRPAAHSSSSVTDPDAGPEGSRRRG
jgi:hypothetical protein